MAGETLQEKYINELLDPRSAMTPRETAAREEILWLRSQVNGIKESWNAPTPPQKAEKTQGNKREVK